MLAAAAATWVMAIGPSLVLAIELPRPRRRRARRGGVQWRGRALLLVGPRGGSSSPRRLAERPPPQGRPQPCHQWPPEARHERDRSPSTTRIGRDRRLQDGYARQQHLKSKEPKAAASHDTPITVAAETGLPGLALLAWLFVAGALLAFRRVAADVYGQAALVFGLILVAIGVHSLFYNAFFEDPMVWAALGLAALTSRQNKPAQPPQLDRQVEAERQEDQRVDGNKAQGARERDMERLPDHG